MPCAGYQETREQPAVKCERRHASLVIPFLQVHLVPLSSKQDEDIEEQYEHEGFVTQGINHIRNFI